MTAPRTFPLAWPAGRARRKAADRVLGNFKTQDGEAKRRVTAAEAAERLEDEITRLGGKLPILSSNLELRMDGRPRADRGEPADPGVCAYFRLAGRPVSLPCDTFTTTAQNIAALAAHLKATRAIESYGVASGAETLEAFMALPAPEPRGRPWREVLGLPDDFPGPYADEAEALVQARWRRRVRELGGRQGADVAPMAEANIARDQALAELRDAVSSETKVLA